MTLGTQPQAIIPGKGLGRFLLGVSLRDILSYIKTHNAEEIPSIKILTDSRSATLKPTYISLPENGIRLRFDGPDQRLRLIEVLDFTKISLTYKEQDLTKHQDGQPCPTFKQIYSKLFGPTFEGEKLSAYKNSRTTLYMLSWPGVAFNFNVTEWPSGVDFVSVLSSPAASPAVSMSIFSGSSWKDARKNLDTRPCIHPRRLELAEHPKQPIVDEMELAVIKGRGVIEFKRRTQRPWVMRLGKTTAQDLTADIGPPDIMRPKNDRRLLIHKNANNETNTSSTPDAEGSSISTTNTNDSTITVDEDDNSASGTTGYVDQFFNYYWHGFDILLSTQLTFSPYLRPPYSRGAGHEEDEQQRYTSETPVCTKLILWSNLPGSRFFNRHRRSRWIIDAEGLGDGGPPLTSETPFSQIRQRLNKIWPPGSFPPDASSVGESQVASQLGAKFMVLNREWDDSPGSSIELLGGFEEEDSVVIGNASVDKGKSKGGFGGNARMYGWPGLLFEVRGEEVDGLTIY